MSNLKRMHCRLSHYYKKTLFAVYTTLTHHQITTMSSSQSKFVPSVTERTKSLERLIDDIDKLISKYVETNEDEDEQSVRRFVAGNISSGYLNQLEKAVSLPREQKKLWPKFMSFQIAEDKKNIIYGDDFVYNYNNAQYMDLLTYEWAQIKFEKGDKFQVLQNLVKSNSSSVAKDQTVDSYQSDCNKYRKSIRYMREKYNAHVIVCCYVEHRWQDKYQPLLINNSSKF